MNLKKIRRLREQEVAKKPGVSEGYTRNYVKVEIVDGNENMIGKIIYCEIEEANGDCVLEKQYNV